MTDKIEKIPEQARWEIATKSLTGAYIAISNALTQAVGQEKFDAFNGPLWYEAGKQAREFADGLGLKRDTAEDVEATQDRCVGRTTQCPWHKRWKEQGVEIDTCSAGHQNWGEGAAESLNPAFSFKLTKNMVRGDSHCEWVVERKK